LDSGGVLSVIKFGMIKTLAVMVRGTTLLTDVGTDSATLALELPAMERT